MVRRRLRIGWRKLKAIPDSPDVVAMGFAAGFFFGFTPFLGIRIFLGIAAAWLLGGSKIAAAIGSFLHDLFLPLLPLIVYWEYKIGTFVLVHICGVSAGALPTWHEGIVLNWTLLLTMGWPVLIGSVVIGLPCAAVSYFLMHRFLTQRALRKIQRKIEQDVTGS